MSIASVAPLCQTSSDNGRIHLPPDGIDMRGPYTWSSFDGCAYRVYTGPDWLSAALAEQAERIPASSAVGSAA